MSVYDKRGIEEVAEFLEEEGFELVSSGGTSRVLEAAGCNVKPVGEISGYPELMAGRVKTLHPAIYGGILARRAVSGDLEEIERHNIVPIDWVIVNLYPFGEALEEGLEEAQQLEFIDIGGPTLLRAAAKNFRDIVVVCDREDYPMLMDAWRGSGGIDLSIRRRLAQKVFDLMRDYDGAVAEYLAREGSDGAG